MNVELVRTRAKIKFHLDNLNEQCEKKPFSLSLTIFSSLRSHLNHRKRKYSK